MNEPTEIVVAAIIERNGRILLSQRRPDQTYPGRWEFPGGKRERGEDDDGALRRELREELGIRVRVRQRVWTERSGPLELRFMRCELAGDQIPRALQVAQFRWVDCVDLPRYSFPPADIALVAALSQGRVDLS